ncbi:glycosyltransferase family 4 protein [Pseudodesulfovibrio senegalensis]|uniref:Glycosyltransferase family 4 protein n=1 Tax=Pseudodesulfovibrio senegalensis TaxID=1721087 RepID=A0A6N6N0U8_9BACT|nr:glycosyltransferase family 4 protein [Pseudodesulfovibrio senegalensis]KAB1439057.1 glycosyltransferase family 4 protein [Pseudodesulfovibrio senegalensis]
MNPSDTQQKTLGMVLKGFPRISETFISNELRLLETMGFRIHIFSMRCPRESFSHDSVKEIKAGVTYLPETMTKGLPALLWHTFMLMLERPGRFFSGLRMLGKRFALAPKKYTWLKHFMQAAFLVRKAKGLNLGHIHAHFAHTPATVGLYAAHFEGVPFSFTAHAKDIYTQAPERIMDKIDAASFLVTCTQYNKRHLEEVVRSAKPVHCVYHGINLDLFSCNGRPAKASAPYSIMTVARFVPKKGLDIILRALARLREKGVDFRYTLLGDGALRDEIKAQVRDLGLQDVVDMPGTVTHDAVIERFRTADIFVLGCRQAADGDRDGIPNVVAESMAMGVPVAATNISGVPELVEHEQTGLLCESESVDDMEAAIERLLTDADLRARVIPAARAKVEAVFNNKELIRDLGEIYKSHGVPCGE